MHDTNPPFSRRAHAAFPRTCRAFATHHLLYLLAAGLLAVATFTPRAADLTLSPSTATLTTNAPPHRTPIANIQVGTWVLTPGSFPAPGSLSSASNPSEGRPQKSRPGESVGSPPDNTAAPYLTPSTAPAWRKITFELTDDVGTTTHVDLLRPATWVVEQDLYPYATTYLDLAELGAAGNALVTSLGPCPKLTPSPGPDYRLVTATFKHTPAPPGSFPGSSPSASNPAPSAGAGRPQMSASESVGAPTTQLPGAGILALHIEGLAAPITVTPNHPIWCEEADAFIPAGDLKVGNHLRQAFGPPVRLTTIQPRAPAPGNAPSANDAQHTPVPGGNFGGPVYNLEVQDRHVYQVSELGILVHNKGGESFFAKYNRPSFRNRGFALAGKDGPASNGPKYWNNTTTFRGNRVYQRDDLIDFYRLDADGNTNLGRMLKRKAPIGPDGESINLHHMLQTMDGPIAEVTETFHRVNHRIIHINTPDIPSGIDKIAFKKWREAYWKQRARDFMDLQ